MSIGRAGDHPPPAIPASGPVTPIEPILIPVEPQPEALIAVGWRVCNSRLLYCESKQLSRGVEFLHSVQIQEPFISPSASSFIIETVLNTTVTMGVMHWICARKRHYEEAINCLARFCYWACYFRLWLPVEVDCYRRVATLTWQRVRQVVSCTFLTTIQGRGTSKPLNTSLPCRRDNKSNHPAYAPRRLTDLKAPAAVRRLSHAWW